MLEWRNCQFAWNEECQELKCCVRRVEIGKRNVEVELKRMRAQLFEVKVGSSGLQGEIQELHCQLEASE